MPARRWDRRQNGVSTRDPGRTRNTEASGTVGVCAARRRRSANAQALDPSRIGIEHFELDAYWVADDFATLRHPAGKARDQPAQSIHFFLISVRAQPSAFMRFEHLYRCARIGDQGPVAAFYEARSAGLIVLV